jgi:hypothetical protein
VRLGLAGAVLGLLAAGEAFAQSRPQLIPTRDVDVTYRVTQAGRTLEERVRWLAAEQIQRVDSSGPVYMIVDHKTRRLTLVNTAKRTVLAMAAPRQSPLDPASDAAAFANAGQASVVGLPCTQWRMSAGGEKQLCVTDDGVMLRAQDAGTTVAEATTVRYGQADPASFQVPTDFQSVPPPAAAQAPPGTGALPPQ